jgi:P4 family phage/plasmid primase-like protien
MTEQLDIQLDTQLRGAGYAFTTRDILWDGELHYINGDAPFNIKGWYVAKSRALGTTTVRTIYLGEWIKNEKQVFQATTAKLSKQQQAELGEEEAQERARAKRAKESLQGEKALHSLREWERFVHCEEATEYLERKGLWELAKRCGVDVKSAFLGAKIVRESGECVLKIPMTDIAGKLWGIQTIDSNGSKHFEDGQRIEQTKLFMGQLNPKGVVYIAEGFSTGATIHLCTGKTVCVAFGAGNFSGIAEALRSNYPHLKIVLCPDNDIYKLGGDFRPLETGYHAARIACSRTASTLVKPCFDNLPSETKPTDFNDLFLLAGAESVARQINEHRALLPIEYVPTEHLGFYAETLVAGKLIKQPKTDDLVAFYLRDNPTIVLNRSKIIYSWEKSHYEEVPRGTVEHFAEHHFQREYGEFTCDNRLAGEFVGKLQRHNHVIDEWFHESTKRLVNFQNGVLNFDSGEFLPHSPKFGFRAVLPVEYDTKATAPTFEKVLAKILQNDTERIDAVLEFFGYCLSNDECWAHKALLLLGDGSNGKSTILEVLQGLLGEKNYSAKKMRDLSTETGLYSLVGKAANICADDSQSNSQRDFGGEDTFKDLVSGGTIEARKLYSDADKFKNRAKLVFAFNKFDKLQDLSYGYARRLLIIPFELKILKTDPDFDPFIQDKLQLELAGVFNLVREKYLRAKARGSLTDPKRSQEKLEDLSHESDSVSIFLEDNLLIKTKRNEEFFSETPEKRPEWFKEETGKKYLLTKELHKEYAEFCKEDGHKPFARSHFAKRVAETLSRHGIEAQCTRKRFGMVQQKVVEF